MIKKLKETTAFVHWYHWIVISLSLLLTVIAWKVADNQVQEKRSELFKIQTEQLLEHVSERMSHYEIGLKAGAAAIQSITQSTQVEEWAKFSNALNIADTYPGVNGIGVIYYVQPNKLDNFLDGQRQSRPDFKIRPIHDKQEYWPITYIEPLANNKKAVGLDIAFEQNRLSAAKKARDTNTTQITAPITLVQDAKKTPGFLQYVPFYNNQNIDTLEQRQQSFVGHVYAPFIMSKLMEGALSQSNRQLIFSISDGKDMLYNEIEYTNQNYDKKPIFQKEVLLDMYGRPWKFQIQTANSFRSSTSSNQPLIILGSGIVIDIMLLFLFITLTHSQQRAIVLAKKITRELSNKEEYYRNITASAPCGIIIANENGEIETVNPQTCVLFGYSKEEMIGKNVDLLIPVRYQHQHPQHRKNFKENPSHRRMGLGRDIFGLTKKGDEFPAEIGLAQFSSEDGPKTLATIIDMTEHVQVTQELKRSNKDLNDFAYVASHDLKAPLRGIMQLSAWIEEDIAEYANEETKSNLKLLMNRTSRLEKLLEDLLDYSRIGRKVGDIQTVDTKELVLSIFDLQDAPDNITLTCQGDMPLINTRITPLETIMRNLIGNAIKHNNETDGIITISVQDHPKHYEFSVQDNGPGIPVRYHEQIFELFKTLQPRDEVEGSGMGLSIIKKLLDYQGGSIVVESDGENGACFKFKWPKEV
ncbi:MAG: CHASE domain-containing protein [Oceanospirillaceae bacterium]